MKRVGEIVFFRKPKAAGKVVKSPDARRITNKEAGQDGVKIVLLQGRSPGSKGRDFEHHGKQVGTQHVRRKAGLRAKHGITVLHGLVHRRKVEVPELLHYFPCSEVKSSVCIRIILTKLSQNTVLIGGMPADVNRFQSVHLQSRANLLFN